MPYVISANRLSDGAVIYYGNNDEEWTLRIDAAKLVLTELEAEALLARAETQHQVIAPYIIKTSDDLPYHPDLFREQMRTKGPSVRRDLGLQAGQIPPK